MPGGELAAIACALDQDALHLFLLHAQPDGPGPVLEDVLDIGRAVPAAGIDAIESLRVAPGIIVNLQRIVGRG